MFRVTAAIDQLTHMVLDIFHVHFFGSGEDSTMLVERERVFIILLHADSDGK